MKRDAWNKCAVCGKFIPYEDFVDGKASNRLVTPESLHTRETFEALCRDHNTPPASTE